MNESRDDADTKEEDAFLRIYLGTKAASTRYSPGPGRGPYIEGSTKGTRPSPEDAKRDVDDFDLCLEYI
jgi:hypothetical protein